MQLTIGKKFFLAFGLMFLLIVSIVTVSLWIGTQESDAVTLNLIGRQRMISQKYGKEVLQELSAQRMTESITDRASVAANQIVADRQYYTKNVIGKLKKEWDGFKAGVDYHSVEGSIPLPATFVREVSQSLSGTAGYSYELLSKWPIDKNQGLHSDLEHQAWDFLSANPSKSISLFTKSKNGTEMHYAVADVAGAGCVSCHNSHPDSPKSNFNNGDLMGILVVSVPVPESVSMMFGNGSTTGEPVFKKTQALFEKTLNALMKGGETYTDLEMTKPIIIPELGSSEIKTQLQGVSQQWEQLIKLSNTLFTVNSQSAEYASALTEFTALNPQILKGMNSAVVMFQADAGKRASQLKTTQYIVAGLAMLVFVLTTWWMRVSVLRRIRNMAALTLDMTEGSKDLNQRFDDRGIDELSQLASSCNAFVNQLEEMIAASANTAEDLQNKVNQLLLVTKEAGEGNLTEKIPFSGTDTMGQLGDGFATMIENISTALSEIAGGTSQIDQGTQQIAGASQSLSEGASEQAANLEEISSSLEEMSSMTNQNAENAKQAASLSEESQSSADKGQKEMSQMTEAMDEIKKSSGEISKIIKVIDEIAFQTNLLALNAAVEAARAGEAGKGFAVVAEEVRNLAQRSAEAAKNTSAMIEESTTRADNGVSIAERVSEALEEIVTSTNKVNTLLSEIASASQEQAEGIEQVNKGISELDKVTQQNAGNAEELASGAEETAAQVASLREVVNRFNTGGSVDTSNTGPSVDFNNQQNQPKVKSISATAVKTKSGSDNPESIIPMNNDGGGDGFESF